MSQTLRKQLDDHPLVLCFDILQQMGKPGEYVWKNGEKIASVGARVEYLKEAILWLRAKLKESNRIPYRELPVDFRTFVESDDLMKKRDVLWPNVIKAGAEINSGKYVEAVLTGGIGVAKTTLAVYTMSYQLYILACLKDPHALFDLDPSSEILMVFQSINKNLAKDVDYKRFRDMVDGSPYFRKVFPFDAGRESDMRFPRNIIVKPVAGQDTAAIGQNVIGGIIDECLVAGTQIETPRGTVQIETLQPGDFVLAARRDGCLVWDEVTVVSQTGVRPVFKIDIDTGESIVGTANHPIATPHGWTDLSVLSPGGFVYIAGAKGPRSLHGMASAFVKPTTPHAFRRDGSEDTSDKIDEATCDRSELCAAPAHAAFPSRENNVEQGEVRTRAGLGASEQFNGRNARDAVEVECEAMGKFTEPGAASNDAQGRSSARCFGTQGLEAQRGHKGAAVGSAHCLYAERRLPWEGQPLYQSQDDPRYGMASFVVGASLRVRTGPEPQRVVLRVRKGSDHLSVGRRGENHPARFPRDVHERREMYGRGEAAIRGENAGFEDCRDEVVRPEQWLGLSAANRARVVGISAVGNAPVYNLTTRRTHTYVANGVIVHNCNFMAVVEKSKQTRGETYDQAAQNYNSIARRRESRFMQMGTLPGMLCLVSSRNYPGGLTDRKEAEARTNPHIYIYDKRIWELRPDRFAGEKFRVFTGDETRKPRILNEHDIVPDEDERLVMAIPAEYRRTFDNDLLAALRDVAGVSTMALHPFMLNTEAVVKCFGKVPSIASREDCDFKTTRIELYPKRIVNPNEPRFAHLDLALTKDSAGVVIGHVPGFRHINRGDYTETLPIVQMDMILEVKPPRGGEIELENIRGLLYTLRDKLLLPIKWVSFDQYQSRDSMQIMHQNGFIVGYQSMDIDTEAYDVTKQAFYDDRIIAPAHAKAQKEMITLEMDTKKNKIDHPPQGSKDVSDAFAGVVFGLTMRREIWLRHQIPLQRIPQSLTAKAQTQQNITEKERRGETGENERRPDESHMDFIRRQRGLAPGARNEE